MPHPAPSTPSRQPLLSVVVPAYNEQDVLPEFHRRLATVLDSIPMDVEVLYVNDGSTDHTLNLLRAFQQEDPRVTILDLSRNFGKELALTAGLDHASGDAVVVIDADLQDPPEVIPAFLAEWDHGYDVVYGRRVARDGETRLKRASAYVFYRLINAVSQIPIPRDTGDFRLLSRRAVESLRQLREQHRFMKGLFAWIGYGQIAVPYHRDPRYAGQTKWNYWRLWNFALEGITSFTIGPLKAATYLGILTALGAFGYVAFVIWRTLWYGDPVAGYPSMMVAILFLGGVQLMTVGVMGEYLGRMFDESKHRPLYLLNALHPRGGYSTPLDRAAPYPREAAVSPSPQTIRSSPERC